MLRLTFTVALFTSVLAAPAAFAQFSERGDVTGSLPNGRRVAQTIPVSRLSPAAAPVIARKRCEGTACIRMFGSVGVGY
jgi:hypothetical protein